MFASEAGMVCASEVVSVVDSILVGAAECAALENKSIQVCNFRGFKEVLERLHFSVESGVLVDFELRIERDAPKWLSAVDPFLFQEILNDQQIRLLQV